MPMTAIVILTTNNKKKNKWKDNIYFPINFLKFFFFKLFNNQVSEDTKPFGNVYQMF
jgi:hypothetical protein